MTLKSLAKRILSSRIIATGFGWLYNGWQRFQYDQYRQEYDIDEDFRFNGEGINLYGDGNIVANSDSYIGRLSRIASVEGTTVIIGKNCAISHHVMMYTGNRYADQDLSQADVKKSRGDITIGDDVWVGANVFITEGVEIGDNAVIGANSVVTRDIPPHTIAAGTPAKVRKFKSYIDDNSKQNIIEEYPDSIDKQLL